MLAECGGSHCLPRIGGVIRLEHAVTPSGCIESTFGVVEVGRELSPWNLLAWLKTKHEKSKNLLKQTDKVRVCRRHIRDDDNQQLQIDKSCYKENAEDDDQP